ncbi:MAG: VOC family protein [Planctomycetota bacterium]|nr:MAG: VOC family protein [Planctomycetota bacterium]
MGQAGTGDRRIVTKTIFPVRDMDEAQAFYRAAGFEIQAYDETYAFVMHDGAELLHLAHAPSLDPAANRAGIYLHVVSADDWHERFRAAGLPVSTVIDEEFGMREFKLRDPSGNLIRVGQNL